MRTLRLLWLVLGFVNPILSQSTPIGLQTQENGPEFYELGQYNKTRTQFDGVTHDQKVNYLSMTRDTGVLIPLLSTGDTNATDFTVMFWFKFSQSDGDQDLMQLFSFKESAACFITRGLTVICDNGDRKKLTVSTGDLKPGLWYHLTLSMAKDGKESYLMLQNNEKGVLAIDVNNDLEAGAFFFVQDTLSRWEACLGDCYGNLGLVGGMREVVMRNIFINQKEAVLARNMQFTYAPDFKAYFRF